MTEPSSNAPRAHARKFAQVSKNLQKLANELDVQNPGFGRDSVGRAFMVVALAALTETAGAAATAGYLRELADGLESGRTN